MTCINHVMAIYTSVIRLKGRWLVTPATFLLQVLCGEPVLCNARTHEQNQTLDEIHLAFTKRFRMACLRCISSAAGAAALVQP
jgi:hypothetical protein